MSRHLFIVILLSLLALTPAPKEITGVKEFLEITRRKDARLVKIKQNLGETKFKVRCSRYLYTYVCKEKAKAEKITESLPKTLKQVVLPADKKYRQEQRRKANETAEAKVVDAEEQKLSSEFRDENVQFSLALVCLAAFTLALIGSQCVAQKKRRSEKPLLMSA
eukprot:gnl/TRDRNA2_/TRDRNA2_191630_c0_seq1.p1 gnl/TRDRNA2_/TRDRNA2_191630_c0~~gnl/TRDRNA2_/TRDRNA2_191630_c0_seq1.p1  ORF type:complete len:164 (-),score=41.50 gnl/TRDRNA2_/TRDRNA2_191630_c0_seq1:55-546(-)